MKIVIGQEAICPDGLGRVKSFDDNRITVSTYINNRDCDWAKENVTLIELPNFRNEVLDMMNNYFHGVRGQLEIPACNLRYTTKEKHEKATKDKCRTIMDMITRVKEL